MRIKKVFTCTLVTLWILSAAQARAGTEAHELKISMRTLSGGHLSDGMVIGTGKVTHAGAHNGFKVRLTQEESRRAGYVLTGENAPSHRLLVRLARPDKSAEYGENKELIIHAGNIQSSFDIIVDGDQDINPDRYAVTAKVIIND